MDKDSIVKLVGDFSNDSEFNYVSKEAALFPELAGTRIFDPPLVGFADANDALFESYKENSIIGGHYMTPKEWLPGSRTVISMFFHFTREVVENNSKDFTEPSPLWLHGYKEGMDFIKLTLKYITGILNDAGIESMAPILDERFRAVNGKTDDPQFKSHCSNWSERHAAYAAGLGTFGLSKGIITRNGMAGRFGGVVTKGVFEPDKRSYSDIYEFCNGCGLCATHCPVNAISIEKGKEHMPCHQFLEKMKVKHGDRGSCGKCQVKLPCTYNAPRAQGL